MIWNTGLKRQETHISWLSYCAADSQQIRGSVETITPRMTGDGKDGDKAAASAAAAKVCRLCLGAGSGRMHGVYPDSWVKYEWKPTWKYLEKWASVCSVMHGLNTKYSRPDLNEQTPAGAVLMRPLLIHIAGAPESGHFFSRIANYNHLRQHHTTDTTTPLTRSILDPVALRYVQ